MRLWLRRWLGVTDIEKRTTRCEQSIVGLDRAVAYLYIGPDKPQK